MGVFKKKFLCQNCIRHWHKVAKLTSFLFSAALPRVDQVLNSRANRRLPENDRPEGENPLPGREDPDLPPPPRLADPPRATARGRASERGAGPGLYTPLHRAAQLPGQAGGGDQNPVLLSHGRDPAPDRRMAPGCDDHTGTRQFVSVIQTCSPTSKFHRVVSSALFGYVDRCYLLCLWSNVVYTLQYRIVCSRECYVFVRICLVVWFSVSALGTAGEHWFNVNSGFGTFLRKDFSLSVKI